MTQMMHQSDQLIQATVSDELLYTPSIDSHPTVAVRDGIVTLTGDVASVPERITAERAAGRVWGVKAVIDQMVVRSAGASGASDADLARSATAMLDLTVDVPTNAVQVEVRDRTITLTGVVTWHFQRQAAARALSHIRGINGVTNTLTLNENANVSIVKDGVEAAIRRNTPLDASAITVDVHGHTVRLGGCVRSSAERRQADRIAWAAAGVTGVQNDLIIAS